MAYAFRYGDRPLDGITIQRAVGRGGFGEVYYSLTDSGKQVALKYLRQNADIELRGISLMMNLKSPHLITIYDVRKNDFGEPFVVMEYVSGPSLRDVINASPSGLSPQQAAFFVQGIASGLNYLHDRGIVHRDLKPGNIFYDDGYVKIGDYGLSKHMAVSQHSGQTVSVGTVHYMAPEIGSGNYTKAIDIYALGVILYEMLTGRLPYTGSSMAEILMRHLNDAPDLAGVREPFAHVIRRALAKDPNDRYPDSNAMVDDLLSSGEVTAAMQSFDPQTLTQVPREADEDGEDATLTHTPPRPAAPTLDVRAGAGQPRPGSPEARAERRARRAAERLARRDRRPVADPRDVFIQSRDRRAQVVTLGIVAIAIAAGLGFRNPATIAPLALYMLSATVSALFSYFVLLQRNAVRSPLLDRLVYAGVGFLAMAFAYGIADQGTKRLVLPIVATLGLCDWSLRIRTGQRQKISGNHAFAAALSGLITGAFAQVNPLTAAALAAAVSLLTEGAAAMWPVTASGAPFQPSRPAGAGGPALAGVAPGRAPNVTPPPVPGMAQRSADVGRTPPPPPTGAPAAATPAASPTRPAEPSFVGRTANAGLSMVGKLLLVFGLALALVPKLDVNPDGRGFGVHIDDGHVQIFNNGEQKVTGRYWSPALLLPIAFGGMLLVLARRHAGAGHVIRGAIGTLLLLTATVIAIGPAREALVAIASPPYTMESLPRDLSPLAALGIMLVIGLVLLSCPRRQRRGKTIIV